MPQTSLTDYLESLDKAGLLTRISEEKRVDELPRIMEEHPDDGVLVENVKDCRFPFFANGYGVRAMIALALDCESENLAPTLAEVTQKRVAHQVVDEAPVHDVVLTGDDVDLSIFPLFLHHPWDGHAYLSDTNVVSRNPTTGQMDWGLYRFMYRSRNETNIDMRNDSHLARINARDYLARGEDMPIAVVIGGPALDKIASMFSYPGVDDWDVLGGFYGEPARVVRCRTNDLTVPANAEIVLEGRVITSEGWVHDEGPFGEYTGTYGGGLPRNNRVVIDAITHRRGAIYQYATIGGLHPGRTDMLVGQPCVETDIYRALVAAGIDVRHVHLPEAGCSNVAYLSIGTLGGGDAHQALSIALTCSRQWHPKVAFVFDEDIDIFDPDRVMWALAWRFNPEHGTQVLHGQNMLPLDPSLNTNKPPVQVTKIGIDCTIPLVGDDIDPFAYAAAVVSEPLAVPDDVTPMSEDDLRDAMEALIREKPRSWEAIAGHFAGQPYPVLYRAFGQLRPRLGRVADDRPGYPYTFATEDFVTGDQVS